LFYIKISQSLLALTSLDVSAVLLCLLQSECRMLQAAIIFTLQPTYPWVCSSPSLEARRLLPVHLS